MKDPLTFFGDDFHDAIDKTIVYFGVRRLVHESRSHHVKGGNLTTIIDDNGTKSMCECGY